MNETRFVSAEKANGLVATGTYRFGTDGKMILSFTEIKADENGTLYYYRDGRLGSGIYNNELVEIDGSIYFVKWSGKVAVNETRFVSAKKANGLVEAGAYAFGADGKLVGPSNEAIDVNLIEEDEFLDVEEAELFNESTLLEEDFDFGEEIA